MRQQVINKVMANIIQDEIDKVEDEEAEDLELAEAIQNIENEDTEEEDRMRIRRGRRMNPSLLDSDSDDVSTNKTFLC